MNININIHQDKDNPSQERHLHDHLDLPSLQPPGHHHQDHHPWHQVRCPHCHASFIPHEPEPILDLSPIPDPPPAAKPPPFAGRYRRPCRLSHLSLRPNQFRLPTKRPSDALNAARRAHAPTRRALVSVRRLLEAYLLGAWDYSPVSSAAGKCWSLASSVVTSGSQAPRKKPHNEPPERQPMNIRPPKINN